MNRDEGRTAPEPPEKLIMGIDPGTNVMGYAIIEVRGQQVKVLEYDVLNLGKNSFCPMN